MSTDPEAAIRIKAEQQLTEHSSKYGQIMQVSNFQLTYYFLLYSVIEKCIFILQSHLIAGVKRSYMFLRLVSCVRRHSIFEFNTIMVYDAYYIRRRNTRYKGIHEWE